MWLLACGFRGAGDENRTRAIRLGMSEASAVTSIVAAQRCFASFVSVRQTLWSSGRTAHSGHGGLPHVRPTAQENTSRFATTCILPGHVPTRCPMSDCD